MNVSEAVTRLKTRRLALVGEQTRIQQQYKTDLATITQQIDAIDNVLAGLADPTQAAAIGALMTALGVAGVKLEFD